MQWYLSELAKQDTAYWARPTYQERIALQQQMSNHPNQGFSMSFS